MCVSFVNVFVICECVCRLCLPFCHLCVICVCHFAISVSFVCLPFCHLCVICVSAFCHLCVICVMCFVFAPLKAEIVFFRNKRLFVNVHERKQYNLVTGGALYIFI